MPHRTASWGTLAFSLSLFALALIGCEAERKVISVRGGLAGIEGAQGGDLAQSTNTRTPRSKAYAEVVASQRQQVETDDTTIDPRSIRIPHEDGSVTLIMTSPRHVVMHLRQTLTLQEPELLYEQVLSEEAKKEYRRNDLDPHEAVEFLMKNRREVLKMLQRMPQGELSPGMFLTKIGKNAYRLEVRGASAQGLSFRRLDVIWEHGVCKLLSIG
jgi:hypothetical protein